MYISYLSALVKPYSRFIAAKFHDAPRHNRKQKFYYNFTIVLLIMQFYAGIRWHLGDGRNRRRHDTAHETEAMREAGPRRERRRERASKKKIRNPGQQVGTHQHNLEVSF